jgi:hypothetical protein
MDYNPCTVHYTSHYTIFLQNKMQITSIPDGHCQENDVCKTMEEIYFQRKEAE